MSVQALKTAEPGDAVPRRVTRRLWGRVALYYPSPFTKSRRFLALSPKRSRPRSRGWYWPPGCSTRRWHSFAMRWRTPAGRLGEALLGEAHLADRRRRRPRRSNPCCPNPRRSTRSDRSHGHEGDGHDARLAARSGCPSCWVTGRRSTGRGRWAMSMTRGWLTPTESPKRPFETKWTLRRSGSGLATRQA